MSGPPCSPCYGAHRPPTWLSVFDLSTGYLLTHADRRLPQDVTAALFCNSSELHLGFERLPQCLEHVTGSGFGISYLWVAQLILVIANFVGNVVPPRPST